jgi:hypothetical protein
MVLKKCVCKYYFYVFYVVNLKVKMGLWSIEKYFNFFWKIFVLLSIIKTFIRVLKLESRIPFWAIVDEPRVNIIS